MKIMKKAVVTETREVENEVDYVNICVSAWNAAKTEAVNALREFSRKLRSASNAIREDAGVSVSLEECVKIIVSDRKKRDPNTFLRLISFAPFSAAVRGVYSEEKWRSHTNITVQDDKRTCFYPPEECDGDGAKCFNVTPQNWPTKSLRLLAFELNAIGTDVDVYDVLCDNIFNPNE